MLDEYFGIQINEDGLVECIPLLLPGYMPNIDMLPVFLMHLGPNVRARFQIYTPMSADIIVGRLEVRKELLCNRLS